MAARGHPVNVSARTEPSAAARRNGSRAFASCSHPTGDAACGSAIFDVPTLVKFIREVTSCCAKSGYPLSVCDMDTDQGAGVVLTWECPMSGKLIKLAAERSHGSTVTLQEKQRRSRSRSIDRFESIRIADLTPSSTASLDKTPVKDVVPFQVRSRGLSFVGFHLGRQNVAERKNNERFISHFGMPVPLAALYKELKDEYPKLCEKDFFIGLNFLRCYPTMPQMAGQWGCHEDTARSTWKKTVQKIASLRERKIKFNPEDFDEDITYLMTVDGVHFTIREQRQDPGPKWYDHKSHSAGVGYKICVAIRRSSIVWINGPFPGKIECSVTC
jgi:hypothetical protein